MSTPAGHSVLHALQATQVPSTSRNSLSPIAASGTAPHTTPCSALARARVERASSRVAAPGGHMVPLSFLHRPAPKHFSTAGAEAALGGVGQARRPAAVAAIVGAEAERLADRRAADDDAGVEQPARVEGVLDRDHRLVETGAEELRQEPAARAPAAVLPRERAVVVGDQASDLDGELLHARHAGRRLEVEHRAEVQAPGGRVTCEAGAGAVGRDDPLQVGDEVRRAAPAPPRCPRRTPRGAPPPALP